MREYVYLVLTSQVQARSSIVGNSVPAVDSQQAFKGMFKALLNEDYSIGNDTEWYKGVLEHALSKVYFSVGISIYMFPSNLNLRIGKTKGYKHEISGFKHEVTKLFKKLNVEIRTAKTKCWQNCCLSQWMLKTLKKYQ